MKNGIDPKTALCVVTLLENLTKENKGWRRWLSRWTISHEPLRNDAKNILELIKRIEMKETAFRASMAANAKYSHIKPRC